MRELQKGEWVRWTYTNEALAPNVIGGNTAEVVEVRKLPTGVVVTTFVDLDNLGNEPNNFEVEGEIPDDAYEVIEPS